MLSLLRISIKKSELQVPTQLAHSNTTKSFLFPRACDRASVSLFRAAHAHLALSGRKMCLIMMMEAHHRVVQDRGLGLPRLSACHRYSVTPMLAVWPAPKAGAQVSVPSHNPCDAISSVSLVGRVFHLSKSLTNLGASLCHSAGRPEQARWLSAGCPSLSLV